MRSGRESGPEVQLSETAARVLGSIVEKALTTPQQYPLTLTALVAACNQTSNRDPVVSYDEETVMRGVDELKEKKLVRSVLPSHGRTAVRFRHVLDETLALDQRQCALMAVLLLRGPQTIGELRIRTERMAEFDGLGEVEHELGYMASFTEPLAVNSGRRPGQKEERWICPVVTPSQAESRPAPQHQQTGRDESALQDSAVGVSADDLGAEVALLRAEVGDLRRELRELRASLGD
jgi:uncharacterized protein YceH (UPF0502 family)